MFRVVYDFIVETGKLIQAVFEIYKCGNVHMLDNFLALEAVSIEKKHK